MEHGDSRRSFSVVGVVAGGLVLLAGVILCVVVPRLESIYKDLGIALPGLTEHIISASRWGVGYLIAVIGLAMMAATRGMRPWLTVEMQWLALLAAIALLAALAFGCAAPLLHISTGPISAST